MSILLFGAGAVAFVAGAVMIGFGIPINEFSFGNTLIMSGTTAAVGGLIIAGLGAAVSHLQRIADALATRAPIRSSLPFNTFEPPAAARPGAAPGRIPFPPKLRTEPMPDSDQREPAPFGPMADSPYGMPLKNQAPDYLAPSLPNPDEPRVTVEDEVSLSPRQPIAPAEPAELDESELEEARDEQPKRTAGRHSPPPVVPVPARPSQNTYFDAMWPAESKSAERKPAEPKASETESAKLKVTEPKWDNSPPADEDLPEPAFDQQADEQAPNDKPRAVAILKSGVVDGMGYTLYVDGSIEAELPQGTLRFASINELRSHLEKT